MADTVIEAHQLLHPFLVVRQCLAGARRSASSVARAFVVGSQPQPRRLPVTSHPSWLCPAARACGLPAANRAGQPLTGRGTGWEDAGGLRSPGVHSQRDCGTIAFDIPLRIDKGG
jgi:hypothetical protein